MHQQQRATSSKKGVSPEVLHNRNLDHAIKSLEDQIQLTIYNYQNLLQTEKRNSAERSEFLLYLVQSLRLRHMQEMQALNSQVNATEGQRQSTQSMQKQMENIGEGLEQIMQESNKLQEQNQELTKQLQESENKEKELDNEIKVCEQEIEQIRQKIDEWQKIKIKWNRHKKQMLQMIEDAQKAIAQSPLNREDTSSASDRSICRETGQEKETCDHCQKNKIQQLYLKYNEGGKVIHSKFT